MKVLILTKYNEHAASSRYRFYNYCSYFDDSTISYVFKPLLPDDYVSNLYSNKRSIVFRQQVFAIIKRIFFLLLKSNNYDLILIEKELLPNVPYFVEKLLLNSKAYALDFDDYIATDYKKNPYKKLFLFHKIDKLSQNAKFVTVGNKWYFDEIKSKNLVYLPTVITIDKYKKVKNHSLPQVVKIVWIGSPATAKYLSVVKDVLEKLSQKHDIVLNVIGANFVSNKIKVNLIQWKSETEVQHLLDSDIGIMPLANTVWEKGKCGFKLIQYMACGLPVVASPTPANLEIVSHAISGYIANTEEEWFDYLQKLITDSTKRSIFGTEGRKTVERNYSYEVWGPRYCEIIKNSIA